MSDVATLKDRIAKLEALAENNPNEAEAEFARKKALELRAKLPTDHDPSPQIQTGTSNRMSDIIASKASDARARERARKRKEYIREETRKMNAMLGKKESK